MVGRRPSPRLWEDSMICGVGGGVGGGGGGGGGGGIRASDFIAVEAGGEVAPILLSPATR